MNYIVSGMISMLQAGLATVSMSFSELQALCEEPELHEFEDYDEMLAMWVEAKAEFSSQSTRSRAGV